MVLLFFFYLGLEWALSQMDPSAKATNCLLLPVLLLQPAGSKQMLLGGVGGGVGGEGVGRQRGTVIGRKSL
jgi:hypothetical protein